VKQTIAWFLVFLLLFSVGAKFFAVEEKPEWANPYADVTEDMWSYQYITELNRMGILPDSDAFEPETLETRGNLVQYLYNMDQTLFEKESRNREKARTAESPPAGFLDVELDTPLWEAVNWAYQNGIVYGTSEITFSPKDPLTREQVCTFLTRFAALENIRLIKVAEPEQFKDSLDVSEYARSPVTVCQMAGIVKGYEDGYLYPQSNITKQECAACLYRVYNASQATPSEEDEVIDLTEGAYDSLYNSYTDYHFVVLLPESKEPPMSYFYKTVFIGDSVSQTLEAYCGSTGAMAGAKFLCAGSMSATNMLSGKILPEYPKGSGEKPPIEDSVEATGAEVVYVMLGMDNIAYGIDKSTRDMEKILTNITDKNPTVQIIVESVTPMADSSTSYSAKLNNDTINAYNARMLELCEVHQWHYLNVAEVFRDENGFLKKEYCSDYGKMGMHFTYQGAEVWVNYIKTHVPQELVDD